MKLVPPDDFNVTGKKKKRVFRIRSYLRKKKEEGKQQQMLAL